MLYYQEVIRKFYKSIYQNIQLRFEVQDYDSGK